VEVENLIDDYWLYKSDIKKILNEVNKIYNKIIDIDRKESDENQK